MSSVSLEVCVDTPQSLKAAFAGGASRVELCSALEVGGLTPSGGLMREASAIQGSVYVMIRPRSGGFVFSIDEIDTMRRDIDLVREMGLAGVVLGASQKNGALDIKTLEILSTQAEGLGRTLHRAFDVTPDPFEALEAAISLKFERILTSGQQKKAIEGINLLAELARRSATQLSIMPGSGININNIKEIIGSSDLFTEVHASCSRPCPMASGKDLELGFEPLRRIETDKTIVAEMVSALSERK